MSPKGDPTTKRTGQVTVGRKINFQLRQLEAIEFSSEANRELTAEI
jgi:hypothetical protein